MAGNYRRTYHYPGQPDLSEREWKTLWLQPHDESRVPEQVRVYEDRDGWTGYRLNDTTKLEHRWIRGLWKEVVSPFGEMNQLVPVTHEDDETTQEEVIV